MPGFPAGYVESVADAEIPVVTSVQVKVVPTTLSFIVSPLAGMGHPATTPLLPVPFVNR